MICLCEYPVSVTHNVIFKSGSHGEILRIIEPSFLGAIHLYSSNNFGSWVDQVAAFVFSQLLFTLILGWVR